MKLINLSRRSRVFQPKRINIRDKNFERRISDNGEAFLLAWDMTNRRSIVLTPSMDHDSCNELVRASNKALSDCCLLTANAECTCFIDTDDLSLGTITIGIFNEKSE